MPYGTQTSNPSLQRRCATAVRLSLHVRLPDSKFRRGQKQRDREQWGHISLTLPSKGLAPASQGEPLTPDVRTTKAYAKHTRTRKEPIAAAYQHCSSCRTVALHYWFGVRRKFWKQRGPYRWIHIRLANSYCNSSGHCANFCLGKRVVATAAATDRTNSRTAT